MRIMIVDDEPKIRKGLRKTILNCDVEIEEITLAKNGREAIELAGENKFDLIFVDICMPKINGIEFIKSMHNKLPDTFFVIISGHDQFKYAREAVKLNVYDYLLKPVEEENIIDLIKIIKKKIEYKQGEKKHRVWKDEKVIENSENIIKLFLSNWCLGRLNKHDILERLNYLNLEYKEKAILSVVKVLDYYNSSYSKGEDLLIYIYERMKKIEGENGVDTISFIDSDNTIVSLIKDGNIDYVNKQITSFLHEAQYSKCSVFKSEFIVDCVKCLPDTYDDLKEYINQHSKLSSTVFEAKMYIDKNYTNNEISLNIIGNKLGVSPSYLSRLMKQELGVSFVEYITKLRVDGAVQLLQKYRDDIKIYEVADKVGYTSHHYFCKIFKRVKGVSPSDYVRNLL